MGLPADLLQILVCPLCRQPVQEGNDSAIGPHLRCVNPDCGLRYPVRGFPVMLIEKADRACPRCGRPREWANETLSCVGCGLAGGGKLTPG